MTPWCQPVLVSPIFLMDQTHPSYTAGMGIFEVIGALFAWLMKPVVRTPMTTAINRFGIDLNILVVYMGANVGWFQISRLKCANRRYTINLKL